MRPSPRLSFFAACCAAAMLACSVQAMSFAYDMSYGDDGLTSSVAKDAWNCYSIVKNDSHVGYNGGGDYIELKSATSMPITNIFVQYKSSAVNASRALYAYPTTSEGLNGTRRQFSVPKKDSKTTTNFVFTTSEDIRKVKFLAEGSSGTWVIYNVTISTSDPLPAIGAISDQEVGSANTLTVSGITVSSFTGDNIQVTASATYGGANVDPTSYSISVGANGLYTLTFTPAIAGINSGVVSFTVTATGAGGATSESFDCTVTTGVIKTKPTIDQIPNQTVYTLHTVSVPFVVREADESDWVITNAPTVVSSTIPQGRFGYDSNGSFFFTPETADAALSSVVFSITATDPEGDSDPATITVEILPGTPPSMSPIAHQTVAYGSTNFVAIAISKTEDDPITATNLTIKAGTDAPTGDFAVEDGKAWFAPAVADIGNTFSFTLAAEDMHGLSSTNYDVSVILAAPVLKHCPVDDWTATSFTADIEAAVPGVASYNLRYIRHEDDGAPVTNTVSVASFPYVVSGLATTNYVYDVQAVCGAVTSQWSNAKSIDLHKYIAPTYAIPMKGAARGSHHETFDGLISSGSAYWYDARTMPGWYAASSSGSMSDVKYSANSGGSSGTGLFSCQVDDEAVTNRALAARADTQYDEFSFGVMFTNMCKYAVTNLHVSFTAMQFRRYNPISHLYFSYTRSNRLIDYNDPANIWTPVGALDFAAPTQGSSARLYPPTEAPKSADIPFEGVNAIQPGEVIALRWYLDAKSNYPTLGIDDLEVSWRCAWPCHTVIMLQ